VVPDQVLLKAIPSDEGFPALVTDKVPLALVPLDVVQQIAPTDKVGVAECARVRSDFGVSSKVLPQLAPPGKRLIALLTTDNKRYKYYILFLYKKFKTCS
jgi:hypothetical protein